jgi:hypothetical protein
MPPIDYEVRYLTDYLFEAGPVMSGAMAAAPLTHIEIQAWSQLSGIELSPWEARTLRQLSCEHIVESSRASKPDCPPPWSPKAEQIDRPAVAKKIKGLFRL